MSDKRFFKVMIYSIINTVIMSLFVYTTAYETLMYQMVSMVVFNILVPKDEEKAEAGRGR